MSANFSPEYADGTRVRFTNHAGDTLTGTILRAPSAPEPWYLIEGESGETWSITVADIHREVSE